MQDAQVATGRVVVGVDGSVRNLAALEWAVAEAVRRVRPLHLVSVACKASTPPAPWTGDSTIQYSLAETEQMVDRLRRRFGAEAQQVAACGPLEPVAAGVPALKCEVAWAVKAEGAITPADVEQRLRLDVVPTWRDAARPYVDEVLGSSSSR